MAAVYYISPNEIITTDYSYSEAVLEVSILDNGEYAISVTNSTRTNIALNIDIVESSDRDMVGVSISNVST